jgi:dUTP pyrophosphatase
MSITFKLKKLSENAVVPKYAHYGDAGMDLYCSESVSIAPNGRCLVHTGIAIQLPDGYEAQIRSRSGLALKKGIFVLNSPGTIDTGYTGEIGVVLMNTTKDKFDVNVGDRIAQMVIEPITLGKAIVVDELDTTERGAGGFGSTGVSGKIETTSEAKAVNAGDKCLKSIDVGGVDESAKLRFGDMKLAYYFIWLEKNHLVSAIANYEKRFAESDGELINEATKADYARKMMMLADDWLSRHEAYCTTELDMD